MSVSTRDPGWKNAARFSRQAAWVVAIVLSATGFLWLLFGSGPVLGDFEDLSRDEAIGKAALAGGWRWPGTSVSVWSETADRVMVERRWLSMKEATSSIVRGRGGWSDGGSPAYGPAEGVQMLIVCVVVPAALGLLVQRIIRRSLATKPRSASPLMKRKSAPMRSLDKDVTAGDRAQLLRGRR